MKRKIKGLLLVVSMLLGIMGLTGCSNTEQLTDDVKTLPAETVEGYKDSATQTIQAVTGFSDVEIEQYLAQSTEELVVSAVGGWKNSKDSLGAFKGVTQQSLKEEGTKIIVTSVVEFEKATATVPLVIEPTTGSANMSFNINYSLAEKMEMAGLNTVVGLGVVFLVLIFLSVLIALFKYIARLEAMFTKSEATQVPVTEPLVEFPAVNQTEEYVDDRELVAVIAAAIAASENIPADSFVVRSIKKSNARRWKKA